MKITLQNTGKKYNYHWIFRHLDAEFSAPGHYGVLGSNGSGKSTLLKVLSGILTPSEGEITWQYRQKNISEQVFRFAGIVSPHLELIEEFTLEETLRFHQQFRPILPGESIGSIMKISGLGKSNHKPLKNFSSGMKQRVKILLAIMYENPLILLDEPCSNLDQDAVAWYQSLVEKYAGNSIMVVGSNDKETECFSCSSFLNLSL